ncbi:MAG: hypothetical protein IJX96_02245 [Clostridia bacterium]|nr:hypothetical protein [Clostridia bacterium]
MKKIKKSLIPSLLLCGALLCGGAGVAFSNLGGSFAQAEIVATPSQEIAASYTYGSTFTVPDCTFTVSGKQVATSATLTLPDGTQIKDGSVALTQSGKYTVGYFAMVDGKPYVKEYTFTVLGRTVDYTGANTQVSYGNYNKLGANTDGLIVRLGSGDKLTFSQLYDAEDLTREQTLVKGFVTPDSQGIADFSRFVFTLADAENPDIYVEIIGKFYDNISAHGLTYFTAAGNGQIHCGMEGNKLQVNNHVGTPVPASFIAKYTGEGWGMQAPANASPDYRQFSFAFDNEARQVWAGGKFVSDLDDADYYSSFWLGFPSGKVRLSIEARNYSGLTANFCLTEVLGVDLTQTYYEDAEAPVISIENEYESMPDALVGGNYPVPSATANDAVSGNVDVKVSAWYNYGSNFPVQLDITDGKFATKKLGTYAIVYEATDFSGVTAKEVLWVSAKQELPAIEIVKPQTATESKIGEWAEVPAPEATGGSGNLALRTVVKFGAEEWEIDGGFRPEALGEYTVSFEATDYIGRKAVESYTLTVRENDTAVLVETPVFPKAYISGATYTLPVLYANDYSSGKLERKLCSVKVTSGSNEKTYQAGDTFVPTVENSGDTVRIAYLCGDDELTAATVPTVIVWERGGLGMRLIPKNYLYGESVTVSSVKAGDVTALKVEANAAAEKSGFTYINAQQAEGLALEFRTLVGASAFEALEVILTDAENPAIQIKATMQKADGKTRVIVDGTEVLLNSDFDAQTSQVYEIGYAGSAFVINKTSLGVSRTVDGAAFTGFPSGKVYFETNMLGCSQGAAYALYKVNGEDISLTNDNAKPTVAVLGEYGGAYSKGDIYSFASAVGCDVRAPYVSIFLTVTAPDGSIVKATDGTLLDKVIPSKVYDAVLDQYGKYTVTYSAAEEAWQDQYGKKNLSYDFEYFVTVEDEVAPEISFKGGFQTTAKVGDTLYIPDYTLSDNYSASDKIQVIKSVLTPNGVLEVFSEEVNALVCKYAGVYEFRIVVIDEAGNTNTVKHKITVTE